MSLRLSSLTTIWVSNTRIFCHMIHLLKTSLSGFTVLLISFHHWGNLSFSGFDSSLQLLNFSVCHILQVFIAGIFRGLQVAGVIELFNCGGLLRHTVTNKRNKFLRSCLGNVTFFTFEEEDAILAYLRNTLEEISVAVFAHIFIEPLVCVVFVKYALALFRALVGIDLVTESENEAQVLSINLR